MMTWDSGTSCRMIRAASIPSIRGMEMSMSTTSGRNAFAISTASNPSSASPQIGHSTREDSKERRSRRTGSWSSTRRIRNGVKGSHHLPKRIQTSKDSPGHDPIRHVEKLSNIEHSSPHHLANDSLFGYATYQDLAYVHDVSFRSGSVNLRFCELSCVQSFKCLECARPTAKL
jgi:hypothetical protein